MVALKDPLELDGEDLVEVFEEVLNEHVNLGDRVCCDHLVPRPG